jgi:hypothetical protein
MEEHLKGGKQTASISDYTQGGSLLVHLRHLPQLVPAVCTPKVFMQGDVAVFTYPCIGILRWTFTLNVRESMREVVHFDKSEVLFEDLRNALEAHGQNQFK